MLKGKRKKEMPERQIPFERPAYPIQSDFYKISLEEFGRKQHRKGDVKSELMYNYDTNKSVYICGILNYRNKNNSCPHYKNAWQLFE